MTDVMYQLFIFHRKNDLDASIQVARHQIRATHINFLFVVVEEVEDSTVLEEAPNDTVDLDIIAQTR